MVAPAVTGTAGRPRAGLRIPGRRRAKPAAAWVRRQAFDRVPPRGRAALIALGDSHVRVVADAARRPELRAAVSLCSVDGATAQGLRNPNSVTDARSTFERRLRGARPWQSLVFQLGEVDCGFVIWYRAEKHGEPVAAQLARSLAAYRELLVRHLPRHRTLVLSAPPPTIRDGQTWGSVANLRREVRASQRRRTDLTLEYNAMLAGTCAEIGARFVDVTTPTVDPRTALVREDFRHPDPTEHHLHPARYAEVVAGALSRALSS
jgi:hypothetical protein